MQQDLQLTAATNLLSTGAGVAAVPTRQGSGYLNLNKHKGEGVGKCHGTQPIQHIPNLMRPLFRVAIDGAG